jgi:hypothetical protein
MVKRQLDIVLLIPARMNRSGGCVICETQCSPDEHRDGLVWNGR